MKKWWNAILFVSLSTTELFAAEKSKEKIYLTCALTSTYHAQKDKVLPTTGSHGLIVEQESSGSVRIISDKLDVPYVGTMTQVRISASATITLGNSPLQTEEWIEVSRLTGEYKNGFSFDGKPGLIHFGQCKRVMPKF